MNMEQQWVELLKKETENLEVKIREFDEGTLDRKSYKGFSGGFGTYAQREPGQHMLRLRLPGGQLGTEQLKFLADVIAEYGIQKLKLTTCETIQLHNLLPAQVPELIRKAADAGIYCRGGGGDNPRNVMCSPLPVFRSRRCLTCFLMRKRLPVICFPLQETFICRES